MLFFIFLFFIFLIIFYFLFSYYGYYNLFNFYLIAFPDFLPKVTDLDFLLYLTFEHPDLDLSTLSDPQVFNHYAFEFLFEKVYMISYTDIIFHERFLYFFFYLFDEFFFDFFGIKTRICPFMYF